MIKRIRFKKVVYYWLPPILWAFVIFAFSSYPTGRVSGIHWQDFIVKKTAHIVEFAIFTLLLYRALKERGVDKRNAALFAILLAVLYGALDEYHQSYTPGREPRVRDVFFDTLGALIAIYFVWNLLPKAPSKIKLIAMKLEII